MKVSELKSLSNEELQQKEVEFKKSLFDLNFKKRLGSVDKPAQFKLWKRNIARIHTIIRERELENERRKAKN